MESGKQDIENPKKDQDKSEVVENNESNPSEDLIEEAGASETIENESIEEVNESNNDAKIVELNNEISKLNDLIARERAEFINYRKRTSQESLQLEGRTAGKILQEILPAFDAFDQLLTSSHNEQGSMEKFLEGAALIKRQLWQVFENFGVEEIDPKEAEFDPQIMEALSVQEIEDAKMEQVTQVYQKGYRFKERVLRPARVAVNKPKSAN